LPTLYLDTTIYDHIEKGYFPVTDVEALRAAIARRKIIAHVSIPNVEELVGDFTRQRDAAIRRLRIAHDLAGFDCLLKQPSDILNEAIAAYAKANAAPSPLLPTGERKRLRALLDRFLGGDTSSNADMVAIVNGVRRMKEEHRGSMQEGRKRALNDPEWVALSPMQRRAFEFLPFFQDNAEYWAGAYADHTPFGDACRTRGLSGLVAVRPVRLLRAGFLSFMHRAVVGDGVQTRTPKPGDFYDVWHGILASACDVFVTADQDLLAALQSVPSEGFRAVTFHELLRDYVVK